MTKRKELILKRYFKGVLKPLVAAVIRKLIANEKKYRWGNLWARIDWADDLRVEIRAHIDKGDPLDVIIYAAFAWLRGWSLAWPNVLEMSWTIEVEPEATIGTGVFTFDNGQPVPENVVIKLPTVQQLPAYTTAPQPDLVLVATVYFTGQGPFSFDTDQLKAYEDGGASLRDFLVDNGVVNSGPYSQTEMSEFITDVKLETWTRARLEALPEYDG
jgi:hypothetical protein